MGGHRLQPPKRLFSWASKVIGVTTTGGHRLTPRPGCRGSGGHVRGEAVTVTLTLDQQGFLARVVWRPTGSRNRRYVQIEAEGLEAALRSERALRPDRALTTESWSVRSSTGRPCRRAASQTRIVCVGENAMRARNASTGIGQSLRRHGGDHLVADQIDVGVGPAVVFSGDGVSTGRW
jgi:hypothetical protein